MFLYFAESEEVLREIRHQRWWDIPEDQTAINAVERGPSGKAGFVLLFAGFSYKVAGLSVDKQEWIDCGQFWLGYHKEQKPVPETLQRSKIVSGYDRVLNDGQVWHCPTARKWNGSTYNDNLPGVMSCIGGKRGFKTKPEYQHLWELSQSAWDTFLDRDVGAFEQFDMCVVFLSANYRIGPEECSVLELFDDVAVIEVLKAAVDIDMVIELAESKKKVDSPAVG